MIGVSRPGKASIHSPLAWNTTVAALALEKLRQRKTIKQEERRALEKVADELRSLLKVGHIPAQSLVRGESESLTGRLRQSFFTLVALEESAPQHLDLSSFERLSLDLSEVLDRLESGQWEGDLLARTQDQCFDLLDQLAGGLAEGATEDGSDCTT